MAWQPIESAPEKTYILIGKKGEISTTAKLERHPHVSFWTLAEVGGYAEDSDPSYEPTHWMPLPEPPQ